MGTINSSPKVIMVTGAAGYVGSMLCDQFSKSPDLEMIIAIDMLPIPGMLKDNKKIVWITANLYQNVWRIPALINKPEVVIHCAWQSIELYDKADLQKKLNLDSSRAVFEFVFKNQFVKKLIFISDASVYGSNLDNSLEHYFSESDEPKEDEILYGKQKSEAEADLRDFNDKSDGSKQVFVLRPTSISGPRGRAIGTKDQLPAIFVTNDMWGKQLVHEDDVVDVVAMFTFAGLFKKGTYEIYNLASKDLVSASDIANSLQKSVIKFPPLAIRLIFYLAWHLSAGKILTPPGSWKLYDHPVLVRGSKVTERHGFSYYYSAHETLAGGDGRYAPML